MAAAAAPAPPPPPPPPGRPGGGGGGRPPGGPGAPRAAAPPEPHRGTPEHREEGERPGAPLPPVLGVQPLAQPFDRPLEAGAHGFHGDALEVGDGPRLHPLEVAEQDRRPVGLLQLEDGVGDPVQGLGPRDQFRGGRVDALRPGGRLLVAAARPRAPPRVDGGEPKHRPEPPARGGRPAGGRLLEGLEPDLLPEVLGVRVPVDQGPGRPLHPLPVGEERLGSEGGRGSVHGHPGGDRMPSVRWFRTEVNGIGGHLIDQVDAGRAGGLPSG